MSHFFAINAWLLKCEKSSLNSVNPRFTETLKSQSLM